LIIPDPGHMLWLPLFDAKEDLSGHMSMLAKNRDVMPEIDPFYQGVDQNPLDSLYVGSSLFGFG
jgi:hypothetical protein